MDYNDIKSRLLRTFDSLDDRFDENIDNHTNVELWDNGEGVSLTFGNDEEGPLLNKVMTILHNLASLKDNLKNCLKNNGHNPQLVENEINNSIHLQVLIDIVNQEKHGSPLKRSRSKLNPIITDLNNGYRMGSKRKGFGGPTMFIDAIIRDDNGKILFYLDQMIEVCYAKWVYLSNKYNCH